MGLVCVLSDSDVFQVAFGIARIYDEQLEDFTTATAYYLESLEVLKAIAVDSTAWDACMRVTTLGALALCFEKTCAKRVALSAREQPKKAEQYFEQAIAAYEAHCDQSAASPDPESDDEDEEGEGEDEDEEVVEYEDVSESEIAFLADLNSAAAILFYHYGGNLLDQERWEGARDAMEHALTLAENSSMAPEELDDLQQSIHDIWLEMETE
ncbi:hypothetical protein BBJ28_00022873 [Nothophytophthora sp. Chile5]|nr:hypothetical protein BBJ28_00022873 [Nothophytophthora sp. Chile5]